MSATHLIGLIGDEVRPKIHKDTCVGFLLAGIGDINKERQKNFLVVTKGKNILIPDTTYSEIEEFFNKLISRVDIAIILITQKIAEQIRPLITLHKKVIPTIVEIPSKDQPYDPSKDPVLKRVKAMLGQD